MSSPYQLSLLRRTFAALAAAAFVFAGSDVLAQGKVKLTNAGGKDECAYSSMSITPDGSVTVQCSGTTQPPPEPNPVDPSIPGTFRMASATVSVAPSASAQVSVVRSLGSAATTIWWGRSGDGCDATQGALNWAGGQMSNTLPTPMKATGSCTVTLYVGLPGVAGTPISTVVTLDSTQPAPQPNLNCPTGYVQPQNMLTASFAGLGNPLLQMQASGQVVAITMPNLAGLASGQVTFGESAGGAYTPQPVTLEISINKCPGYIDTNYASNCNLRSTNGNYNSLAYLVKSVSAGRNGTFDSNNLPIGYCWAGDSAQYYVNARWSYASCAFGAQVCGFAIQYNQGAY
jgi:hypothetical protein